MPRTVFGFRLVEFEVMVGGHLGREMQWNAGNFRAQGRKEQTWA